MDSLLRQLKKAFPDKAMVVVNGETDLPKDTIGLVFGDDSTCDEIMIAERSVMATRKHLNTKANDFLALSKSSPPRIRLMPAGKNVPRNHFPVAAWDGEQLSVAFPSDLTDPLVRDMFISGLPGLINERPARDDFAAMCDGLSIGLGDEKRRLETEHKNNRAQADKYMEQAKTYIEAAENQARLLRQMDTTEKNIVLDHAKEQWNDIVEMIPRGLQDVKIERGEIIALTAPIILLGNFLGAYKIKVNIKTGDVRVQGATPNVNTTGHPHPHVRETRGGGGCCWGSLTNTYRELKVKKNYSQIIAATLRLLNQFNAGDAYKPLADWGNTYSGTSEESNDCQARGPGHSIAQTKKCLLCDKTAEYCSFKESSSRRIYSSCLALSSPQDCVSCEHTDCPSYEVRFDRCWSLLQKQGSAFCMLRCGRDECTHRAQAQKECTASNKRHDNTCPAADNCWKPCVKVEK